MPNHRQKGFYDQDRGYLIQRGMLEGPMKRKVVFFLPWYKEIMPAIACDIDSTLYLEATVILGKDYQQFIPKALIVF